MDITATHLRYFLAVATELHFGRAAAGLHISAPSLSQQISTLEKRLGRPLFVRTSRRVEPTADGVALIPLARRTIDALDAVIDWASGEVTSLVRIGVMAPNLHTDAALSTAVHRFPEVSWEVHSIGFADAIDALRRDDIDVALVVSTDRPAVDGIASTVLWVERRVLLVHDRHHLAGASGVRMSDIADESFIGIRDTLGSRNWFPDTVTARVRPIANNFDEVLQLCAAGVGVNIAGSGSAGAYARPGISYVPIIDAADVTTYLCRRSSSTGDSVHEFESIALEIASAAPRSRLDAEPNGHT
ncbi:LysR family transcriptional regulator [Rhodococcoides trifolii]|uniref:LysR family transcriptional regulator n=1 Tax=Rhodococcoides trifolii TaxID=908250 RepID=UPI00166C6882|nr:LysR substrate-binding domain-containing protein [Rhodococcus trifolii]